MLRTFEPGDRVAARLELSIGGALRGRSAGVDLMGDGSLVPYSGGIGRHELDVAKGESLVDALRRALT